jgi:hypothetical protein
MSILLFSDHLRIFGENWRLPMCCDKMLSNWKWHRSYYALFTSKNMFNTYAPILKRSIYKLQVPHTCTYLMLPIYIQIKTCSIGTHVPMFYDARFTSYIMFHSNLLHRQNLKRVFILQHKIVPTYKGYSNPARVQVFLGIYTLQCCCLNLICIVIVCTTWEK